MHVDQTKRFILEVDTSNLTHGSVLSHIGEDGQLPLVAFHTRKFEVVEINYEIHDKGILAIVDSFQQWRHF